MPATHLFSHLALPRRLALRSQHTRSGVAPSLPVLPMPSSASTDLWEVTPHSSGELDLLAPSGGAGSAASAAHAGSPSHVRFVGV